MGASVEEMVEIEGIGEVIAASVRDYFANQHNRETIEKLLQYLDFAKVQEQETGEQPLAGKTLVITGTVTQFKNRKELKEYIESLGGKVTGSVSKNTDYLLNNDNLSGSAKNKKAKELGIPILTEEEFLAMTTKGSENKLCRLELTPICRQKGFWNRKIFLSWITSGLCGRTFVRCGSSL